MSSRHHHPLACRLPRAERTAAVAFAQQRGISISGMLKTALRAYLAAQAGCVPSVHQAVDGSADKLLHPLRSMPDRLAAKRLDATAAGKGGFRDR